jgi:hypothetical protein
MDNIKLEGMSTIEILDPTRVNQARHTVNLRKDSEMYKDMTMKEFNKEVALMSKDARARVSLYILRQFMRSCKEARKSSRFHTF